MQSRRLSGGLSVSGCPRAQHLCVPRRLGVRGIAHVTPRRQQVKPVACKASPLSSKLRGSEDWKGLLPEKQKGGTTPLDDRLAEHLVKYAELARVCPDNIYTSWIDLGDDPTKDNPRRLERRKSLSFSLADLKKFREMLSKAFVDKTMRGMQGNYIHIHWAAAAAGEDGALQKCLAHATSKGIQQYVGIEEIYCYAGPNNLMAKVPKRLPEKNFKTLVEVEVEPGSYFEDPLYHELTRAELEELLKKRAEAERDTSQRAFWQGYVAVKKSEDPAMADEDEEIVFAFRGTLRADEWISNIRGSYLVPYSDTDRELNKVLVHLGFRNMYQESYSADLSEEDRDNMNMRTDKLPPKQMIENLLMERYVKKGKPLPKITTTGHSLGAALCTMCAFHIAHDFARTLPETYQQQLKQPGAVTCYPFASPRVGGESFQKAVDRTPGLKILRITNDCDFVPRIPFPEGDTWGEVIRIIIGDALTPEETKKQFRTADAPTSRSLLGTLGSGAAWLAGLEIPDLPKGPEVSLTWACKTASIFGKPSKGESQGVIPNPKQMKGFSIAPWLAGQYFGRPSDEGPQGVIGYVHVGKELRFCSTTAGQAPEFMRTSFGPVAEEELIGTALTALFTAHSLELYRQVIGLIAKTPNKMDLALLNYDSNKLDPVVSKQLAIPSEWWQPDTWILHKLQKLESELNSGDVEEPQPPPQLSSHWAPNKGMQYYPDKGVFRAKGWIADYGKARPE